MGTIFYSRLLKENLVRCWKYPWRRTRLKIIRKWAGIWRSANSRDSILGNEGLIAILAQPPSPSPPMNAIRTSDHHGSNFGYNGQVFRRKHPVLVKVIAWFVVIFAINTTLCSTFIASPHEGNPIIIPSLDVRTELLVWRLLVKIVHSLKLFI